jgi:hypothetical protein
MTPNSLIVNIATYWIYFKVVFRGLNAQPYTKKGSTMKIVLRRIFSPLLNYFEAGKGEFNYRKSHRTALIAAGGLFLILSLVCLWAALTTAQLGAFIPLFVFVTASLVCLVVGTLGNERAVATIWGSK